MSDYSNTEERGNPQKTKKNQIGLIGFILSIAAIIFIWIPSSFEILWLSGLILSVIGVTRKPRKFAIAGMITSLLGLVIAIVALLFDIVSFMFMVG